MDGFNQAALLDKDMRTGNQIAKFYRDQHIQVSIYNTLISKKDSIEIIIDQLSEKSQEIEVKLYFDDDYNKYCTTVKFIKIKNGLKLQLIDMKNPEKELVKEFREKIGLALSRICFRLSNVGQFIFEE